MLENIVFWLGLTVSLAIGLVYFRDLGDVSQMLIRVKRKNMIRFIRNEYRLLGTGLGALLLMTGVHFGFDAGSRVFWWAAILLCVVLYGFPYIWIHVGLRNQKNSANYYSIEEAKEYVSPSNQVIVMENNGVARAHPQAQLLRPHLTGNDEGLDGENVVMTFCAMANLGIGYTPEVEGEKLDLQVMAQHGNNLILRDNRTGEPIQQIYGFREADATPEAEGESRFQSTMFPDRVDDYVEEDSVVRVIDVFIDRLDISGLGFKAEPAETGRPGYHPHTMLKIYVYGYLNQVHSSRRLEREAGRNVELMWLSGRLAPDFKTIANFRKDKGEAIRLVCREFVILCRKLNLLGDTLAIDGSKFKAVNNRDKNFTRAKMKRRLTADEASIDRYLGELDKADRSAPPEDTRSLKDKITAQTEEMDRLKKFEVRMLEAPDQQLSLTDLDARSMKSRGGGLVGYNVQTAVDVDRHLIVAHEVTNVGSDRRQLTKMAQSAKAVTQLDSLNVLADRGYYNGDELQSCEQNNIAAYVPNSVTSRNKAQGLFDRAEFRYIAKDDEYECSAGERLIYRFTREEKGKMIRRYWSSACPHCSLKPRCTSGKNRRVSRWVHEEAIERAAARLAAKPDAMRIRRATVEHPYGSLKAWMGATHFLTKTLDHVSTEMSLHVLAYNMKRVINLIGTKRLLETI